MRQNVEELQDFLSDLATWEKDIKKKDEKLRTGSSASSASGMPPVRGAKAPIKDKTQPIRPKNYMSYGEWDKFDADKALEEASSESEATTDEVPIPPPAPIPRPASTSPPVKPSSSSPTPKPSFSEIKASQAEAEKEKGNSFFKQGSYVEAIAAYTESLRLQPDNAIVHANRSMALIKLERWAEAEADASASIALDPKYVKAYVRRATASSALGKHLAAVHDFQKALELDPPNKDAKDGLAKARVQVLEQEKSAAAKASAPVRRKRMIIREVESETAPEGSQSTEDAPLSTADKQQVSASTVSYIAESKPALVKPPVQAFSAKEEQAASSSTAAASSAEKPSPAPVKPPANAPIKSISPKPVAQVSLKAPTSAIEFERTWNQLKSASAQAEFLKLVQVDAFPKVLKEFLDGELISCIVDVLKQCFTGDSALGALDILEGLSKCPRFKTAVGFLTKQEKADIRAVLAPLEAQHPDRVRSVVALYS
eukprot:tig00000194_g14772.t1